MRLAVRSLALPFLSLALAGCDHATKWAASSYLAGRGPVSLIRGVLELRYAENRDIAFSLTHDLAIPGKRLAIVLVVCLELAVVCGLWWRQRKVASGLEHAGFALVAAGALGNLVDRLARGYVVDFIHLSHWPIFNAADAFVLVGVLGLLLARRRPVSRQSAPI